MAKKKTKKSSDSNVFCFNRKAMYNYEEIEDVEAGIVLYGSEVKSIRMGSVHLNNDSHVGFDGEGMVLYNFEISNLKFIPENLRHDPLRNKRLLLKNREIKKLQGKVKAKGLTIIAKKVYNNKRGFIKVQIVLCKGKKMHDKRQSIKEKDLKLQMSREIKGSY